MYIHYKQPAIYIVTNKKDGTLYTGVTSNLVQRIYQHKAKIIKGFTKKYNCEHLVYYEIFDDMNYAITREKQIKGGSRADKIRMIEEINPEWRDLYHDVVGGEVSF
jgi:putative endonuclease